MRIVSLDMGLARGLGSRLGDESGTKALREEDLIVTFCLNSYIDIHGHILIHRVVCGGVFEELGLSSFSSATYYHERRNNFPTIKE
jgi:hypothetical protein